ncbi:helix-turn-helix domain-containing protein [Natrialbaceae archaeon GCM10025810]|uniref:helix-turn-helix domain-containing protein n=1 Tax=Halovalidus salilacus TaxID=3075124 RepID=UPI00361DC71E
MGSGIRAEVKIDDPPDCPVVQASAATESATTSVAKSVVPDDGEATVTEEFMLEGVDSLEGVEVDADVEFSKLFSYGSKSVFRFDREWDRGCPCERVESFDSPVIDVRTQGTSLYLTFHASDMQALQGIIGELRTRYSGLDVQRLLQSEQEGSDQHLVFVDKSALTARQEEVLETAHEMGYFDHPKRANAGEVAAELDITTSTFTEHLSAAQRKLLGAILDA